MERHSSLTTKCLIIKFYDSVVLKEKYGLGDELG